MQKAYTLKNQDDILTRNQVITPHKEDNLEKQMRGQLEKLKNNSSVGKANPTLTQFFDTNFNDFHKKKRIRGVNSLNKNTFIENQQNNNTTITIEHDSINNIINNNQNQIQSNKNDNSSINSQMQQSNGQKLDSQQNNNQKLNESTITVTGIDNINSKINTPSRIRRHSFVENRYGQDNNSSRGSYLYMRLKQKLDEKESNSYKKDNYNENENKNPIKNTSILPLDNISPQAICQKNGDNGHKNEINFQSSFSVKANNPFSQINKFTHRISKKDENNNSYLAKSNNLNLQSKDISNQSPLRLLSNNNNNNRKACSNIKPTNFYDNNNSGNKSSSQQRTNNSNQKYPTLLKRNENNLTNISYIHQNHSTRNKSLKNKIIEQENCLQQQLKQQMKGYDSQQTPLHLQQQIQRRKFSLIRKQQEIENLFQSTKEELYTSQIEKMSSVGQHVLEQRDKYFNQTKNDLINQQPLKDNEPIHPAISQESIVIATQGSQCDIQQSYKKVSAHELLSKEDKTESNLDNQMYKLKKKKSNNVELVRMSQGENGCIILQGNNQNVLSRNSYDQNDKTTARTSRNKSSNQNFNKKNVKKIDCRYMNQSMKYSQDVQLQSIDGMNKKEVNISQTIISNNQKNEDDQSFSILDQQLEQFFQMGEKYNNQSGIVIYKQKEDIQLQKPQFGSNNNTQRSNTKNDFFSTNIQKQQEFNKESIEMKSDLSTTQQQQQQQYQKSGFGNRKTCPNLVQLDENKKNKQGSACKNQDEKEKENIHSGCQNQEIQRAVSNKIQLQNDNEDEIVSHYVNGSISYGAQQNILGESKRFKKGNSIDNYFSRKYNIDISYDDDKDDSTGSQSSETKRKRKKSKRRRNRKLRNKTAIFGNKDEQYKFKVSKNIMGVYCAKKQMIPNPDKYNSLKGYIK